MKNYRPVSNLSFISKSLEKVVLIQLKNHLSGNNLLEIFQSVYRQNHSTETAVLSVLDSLLGSADERLVSLVALLDLSAAFVTLDHPILLKQLETTFGVRGTVLDWCLLPEWPFSVNHCWWCCVRLPPSCVRRAPGFRVGTGLIYLVLSAFVRCDFCPGLWL